MYIFGHISVKQGVLPDLQVDSGPWVVQLSENNSGLNLPSAWHLIPPKKHRQIYFRFKKHEMDFFKKNKKKNTTTCDYAVFAIHHTPSPSLDIKPIR